MTKRRLTGMCVVLCLLAIVRAASSSSFDQVNQATLASDATLFRVFLKDGTTLVSYGEFARVDDRVVFSMPITAVTPDMPAPPLQLVNLAADRVDWTRTTSYAESARAAHYLATRAVDDYTRLTNDVAQTLNEISLVKDEARRVAIVEAARKKLAEWPAAHYHFNEGEVQQLLLFLDQAIAGLRGAGVPDRLNLSLVAGAGPARPFEPILPPPTLKESIEQVLTAARMADSPAERSSLLSAALSSLDHEAERLPADWVRDESAAIRAAIEAETQADRAYSLLTQTLLRQAAKQARAADVRGLQNLLSQIYDRDQALGGTRPDVVIALVDSVQVQLDAARQLRLARDHWVVRVSAFRRYRTSVRLTLERFARLKPSLEDIKALAGSPPQTLNAVERLAGQILRAVSRIKPPEELQSAHALLVSAAQLAVSAAGIRREAAVTKNITRAWDASSAAAGALMLSARARTEIQSMLRLPQLPQ